VMHGGLLYHANKLCVLASFLHLLFLQEAHGGGLMRHFGVNKTDDVLATHFFWPKMKHDVDAACHGALLATKLSLNLTHMVFTCLFLFLVCFGRIFLWTLSLDCLEQRGGEIVFLWSLIISLKWPILYHATRAIMHHMLLICSSRLFIYMVFQILLSQIGILNSYVIFGEPCGLNWGQNCCFLLHVIPKLS
jgi:hypothetical protein